MPVETMRLSALVVNPALQARSGGVHRDTVADYTESVKGGERFPPLLAFRITDRSYDGPVLVAGFHRHAAYTKAGVAECEVDVRDGTYAEAFLAGYLSNVEQKGLKYTNADKRHAVAVALRLFRRDSARVVAVRLGVSHDLVSRIRRTLVATGVLPPEDKVVGRDGRNQSTKRNNDDDDRQVSSDDTCLKQEAECRDVPDVEIAEEELVSFEDDEPAPVQTEEVREEPDDTPDEGAAATPESSVLGELQDLWAAADERTRAAFLAWVAAP